MTLPLALSLRPSAYLTAVLFLVHGMAAVAVTISDLPTIVRVALWFALAVSLWRSVRHHALRRGSHAVVAMILGSDGELVVERRSGKSEKVRIDQRTTVFSWLVVLLVEADGRSLALTLPRDALGNDAHRQLRLWLRWIAETGNSVAQDRPTF